MQGFTQLSPGMCPIRTLLRGKHPPLLCQATQFSAAFNHKAGRVNLKKKKENREVQWSTCLPVPALLHVCNRKSTETASIFMLICFDIFLSLCQPYKNSVGTNLIDLKLICVATEFKICPPSFKGSADGFRVLNVAWNWDQLRKSVSFQSICCHNVKNSTS